MAMSLGSRFLIVMGSAGAPNKVSCRFTCAIVPVWHNGPTGQAKSSEWLGVSGQWGADGLMCNAIVPVAYITTNYYCIPIRPSFGPWPCVGRGSPVVLVKGTGKTRPGSHAEEWPGLHRDPLT